MTLPPKLIHAIDAARSTGASPHKVLQILHESNVPNPSGDLEEYMRLPADDGTPRTRAETNPGDPSDPSHLAAPHAQ